MILCIVFSRIFRYICILILLQNTTRIFYRTDIVNIMFDIFLKVPLAFMAAGGLIFSMKCETRLSFLRTSTNDVPSDLVDTICNNISSNFSLPTAWLEEAHNELILENYEQHVNYCTLLLICAMFYAVIEKMWSVKVGGQVRKLVPFVTTMMLPNDNKKARENAIVRLMIHSIKENENFFLIQVFVKFMYFLISLCGLIFCKTNPTRNQHFPVHLNGLEWIVNCNRQATARDVHTLIKCPRLSDFDSEFRNLCIVPNENICIHLRVGAMFCFAVLTCVIALFLILSIWMLNSCGFHRCNVMLLLALLKLTVGEKEHNKIIDAFEIKLLERRTSMNGTSSVQQTGEVYNRATDTVTLSVGIHNPD